MSKLKIYVYIPGFEYDSKGPLFIDAIKLDATIGELLVSDNGEIVNSLKVYTYATTSGNNIENNIIYRSITTDAATIQRYENTTLSVVERACYCKTYEDRAPHGCFYDYVEKDPKYTGKYHHIITYQGKKSDYENVSNLNADMHDGIFVLEIKDSLNTTIKLSFNMYSRILDCTSELEIGEIQDINNVDLSEYVHIGTWVQYYNPATSGVEVIKDSQADFVDQYFDLKKWHTDDNINSTWEVPMDGSVLITKFLDLDSKVLRTDKYIYKLYSYDSDTRLHYLDSALDCNKDTFGSGYSGDYYKFFYGNGDVLSIYPNKKYNANLSADLLARNCSVWHVTNIGVELIDLYALGYVYNTSGDFNSSTLTTLLNFSGASLNNFNYLYDLYPVIAILNMITNSDFNQTNSTNCINPVYFGITHKALYLDLIWHDAAEGCWDMSLFPLRKWWLQGLYNELYMFDNGDDYVWDWFRQTPLYTFSISTSLGDYKDTCNITENLSYIKNTSDLNVNTILTNYINKHGLLDNLPTYNGNELGKKTIYYGSSKTDNLIFDGNKHTLSVSGSMHIKFDLGTIDDLLIWVQDVIGKRVGCPYPWVSANWDSLTPSKSWNDIDLSIKNKSELRPFIGINNMLYIDLSSSNITYSNKSNRTVCPYIYNEINGYAGTAKVTANIDISKNLLSTSGDSIENVVSLQKRYPWELRNYMYQGNSSYYDTSFCNELRFVQSSGKIDSFYKPDITLAPGAYVLKVNGSDPAKLVCKLTCTFGTNNYTDIESYHNTWIFWVKGASAELHLTSIKYNNYYILPVQGSTVDKYNFISSIGLYRINLDLTDTNTSALKLNLESLDTTTIITSDHDNIYNLIAFPYAYCATENCIFMDKLHYSQNSSFGNYQSNITKNYNFPYLPKEAYYEVIGWYTIPKKGNKAVDIELNEYYNNIKDTSITDYAIKY